MLLFSCKKDILDVDSNYQGEWHALPIGTLEYYIIIEGNQGVYGELCELTPLGSNCGSYFSGDVKMSRNGKKIFIGPWKNQVFFSVDVPPHINTEGEWECTLTERVYTKN